MIKTTKSFIDAVNAGNHTWIETVNVTLQNGKTLVLSNSDLWDNGIKVEDAVSSDSDFQIGAAITNKLTVTVSNITGKFDRIDFMGALLEPIIELDGFPEVKINKGMFYVVDVPLDNSQIITLTAYDKMMFLDIPYSEVNTSYPANLQTIVRDIASKVGVDLLTTNFPHYDTIINVRPADGALTCRDILSAVAQIACCYARFNVNGKLEIKWYDFESLKKAYANAVLDGVQLIGTTDGTTFYDIIGSVDGDTNVVAGADGDYTNPIKSGVNLIRGVFSDTVSVNDVIITGLKITVKAESKDKDIDYLLGEDEYVVSINENPLITSDNYKMLAADIFRTLKGTTFKKATVSHTSAPWMEAGDVAIIEDRNNIYMIPVTSTIFQVGSQQNTSASAQSPTTSKYTQYSSDIKNLIKAREWVVAEKTEREIAIENLNSAMNSKSGMYYSEKKQSDGSTIYYLHDKPLLDDSSVIMKITADGVGVSPDSGKTWYGLTVDGTMVTRILATSGIVADWIKTGIIQDAKGNNYWNLDTGEFKLSAGATVDGNSIATSKDIVNIDSKIGSLASGSNNLLAYTDVEKSRTVSASSSPIPGSPIDTFKGYGTLGSSKSDVDSGRSFYTLGVRDADSVTVSCDIEVTACTKTGIINILFANDKTSKPLTGGLEITGVGNFHYSKTIKASSFGTDMNRVDFNTASFVGSYTISHMHVELGDKETTWSANPTDWLYETLGASIAVQVDADGVGRISSVADKLEFKGKEVKFDAGTFVLNSTNATISKEGVVNFKSGHIANWNITNHSLYSDKTSNRQVFLSDGNTSSLDFLKVYNGNLSDDNYPFWVKATGEFHASFGNIAGWDIAPNGFFTGEIHGNSVNLWVPQSDENTPVISITRNGKTVFNVDSDGTTLINSSLTFVDPTTNIGLYSKNGKSRLLIDEIYISDKYYGTGDVHFWSLPNYIKGIISGEIKQDW